MALFLSAFTSPLLTKVMNILVFFPVVLVVFNDAPQRITKGDLVVFAIAVPTIIPLF